MIYRAFRWRCNDIKPHTYEQKLEWVKGLALFERLGLHEVAKTMSQEQTPNVDIVARMPYRFLASNHADLPTSSTFPYD